MMSERTLKRKSRNFILPIGYGNCIIVVGDVGNSFTEGCLESVIIEDVLKKT
jgi:hypothetical protein